MYTTETSAFGRHVASSDSVSSPDTLEVSPNKFQRTYDKLKHKRQSIASSN